jgi:hypothetical protein
VFVVRKCDDIKTEQMGKWFAERHVFVRGTCVVAFASARISLLL